MVEHSGPETNRLKTRTNQYLRGHLMFLTTCLTTLDKISKIEAITS